MSMPHAGVVSAAHDTKNGILQPQDLEGLGEYSIRASVVSPSVNVLCVNMEASELEPLIYVTWPNANTTQTPDNQTMPWSGYQGDVQPLPGQTYLNSTAVDDIFEWGADFQRQPPVFPMVLRSFILSDLFLTYCNSYPSISTQWSTSQSPTATRSTCSLNPTPSQTTPCANSGPSSPPPAARTTTSPEPAKVLSKRSAKTPPTRTPTPHPSPTPPRSGLMTGGT